jgi:hypothetical protein
MEFGWHGVGIRLVKVYESATATCAETFITYIRVIVPASNILAADVFGTGIFH